MFARKKTKTIHQTIVDSYKEINELENQIAYLRSYILEIQKKCKHDNYAQVETLDGMKGSFVCFECMAELERIF